MMGNLSGRTILIVEDEMLVALDLAITLESEGARVISTSVLEDALAKCDTPGLSAVILDHKLHHDDTSAVCEKLEKLRIPFIIYSGYTELEGACGRAEIVSKPATPAALMVALSGVLTKDGRPSIHRAV
jgi:DNA-binding NtrC family response regulator